MVEEGEYVASLSVPSAPFFCESQTALKTVLRKKDVCVQV